MIMVLHDPSDIILEVTKMLNYAERELASTVMFVIFMLSWLLTRLVYFPFWIVWSTRSAPCTVGLVLSWRMMPGVPGSMLLCMGHMPHLTRS